MIRVLLPLSMYSVTYELAHGRPYSRLEQLLLRAVDELPGPTGCTFRELSDVFRVHDRLLTEGLVTLIREGWVAMVKHKHEMHYQTTAEGRLTIASGRRPSNLRVRTTRANIMQERLTGQLAKSRDLHMVSSHDLRKATGRSSWKEVLAPRTIRRTINGGEAEPLLPKNDRNQEWIRWIDSVTRVNADLYYLPLRVDPETSQVLGLPYRWQHLAGTILEEVTERRRELTENVRFQHDLTGLMRNPAPRTGPRHSAPAAPAQAPEPYARTAVTCRDIAVTAAQGRAMTAETLSRASANALLVAGHLNPERATVVRDALIGLVNRGVNVDLLWSPEVPDGGVKEILRALDAARAHASGAGKVMFNRSPSPATMDLVMVATDTGPEAVIGSGLLTGADHGGRLSPAARILDTKVLGAVARLAAGWWEECPGEEGTLPAHRWKHLAERWIGDAALRGVTAPSEGEQTDACAAADCSGLVELLLGPQQETVLATLTARDSRRFLVADGRVSAEELMAAAPGTAGRLYRAAGGSNGWCLIRRTAGTGGLVESRAPGPASSVQRIVAADDLWLVAHPNADGATLSFSIRGHAAARAWAHTSRPAPAG
ncbi:hypothetical protein [Streptomyces wuyuanensis]|uniref:hypothetical protein n=1 Tax=Streptomyces wuyuanensis TaxID=1196353 RepID=UPI003D73AA9E